HAGPKEGRLRLLRATGVHLEPIFLLVDGSLEFAHEDPLLEVELAGVRNRLARCTADVNLADAQLLIADGHHRYETALAAGVPYLLAVIVGTAQDGLTIFPTHRLAERVNGLPELAPDGEI